MANTSILAAFERMWQHVSAALGGKADKSHSHKVSDVSDVTVTATEINYLSGVTSNVQTQLNTLPKKMQTTNISAAPTDYNSYPVNVTTDFAIDSLTFPKYAKGMFISTSNGDGILIAVPHANGRPLTAYRSSGTWGSAQKLGTAGETTDYGINSEIFNDYENNVATGNYSSARGRSTTASGTASTAEGVFTTALAYQHVQGHYNNTTTATAGSSSGTGTGTAFVIGNGTNSSRSNAFRVNYAGTIYAASTIQTSGRDYAEFFEWQDLNTNDEDRRGYFVTLDGDKIKIANPNDYILGIVSGQPAILGNGDEDWRGRYILDEFGALITEEFEYDEEVREEVLNEETGERTFETKIVTKIGTKYKENPDYDPSTPYIQREDRPEWDYVGMLGVLSVRDDGTCQVNGYCQVAEGGIATASETGYRVINRVNDNIVEVIFR